LLGKGAALAEDEGVATLEADREGGDERGCDELGVGDVGGEDLGVRGKVVDEAESVRAETPKRLHHHTEKRQVLFTGKGGVLGLFLLLAELSSSKRLAGVCEIGGRGGVDNSNFGQSCSDSVATEVGTKVALVRTPGWARVTGLNLGGDAEGRGSTGEKDLDLVVTPGRGAAGEEAAGEEVRRREVSGAGAASWKDGERR